MKHITLYLKLHDGKEQHLEVDCHISEQANKEQVEELLEQQAKKIIKKFIENQQDWLGEL